MYGFPFFIKGLILGFSIAAPVGPIGLLCIRRTLADGRLHGIVSGLGAATADAIYGSVAGFGLTIVAGFLTGQQFWLQLFGGLFLIYLGVKIFFTRPAERPARSEKKNLPGVYFSTLLLTLSNPATIFMFIAIFAGMGAVSQTEKSLGAFTLVAGVFCGSTLWWVILSSLASIFRSRLTAAAMVWINRLSGILIAGFGLFAMLSLLKM